jgi:uncharacterized protein YrzB (UPF0473 family)
MIPPRRAQCVDTDSAWVLFSVLPRDALRGTRITSEEPEVPLGENEDVITLLDDEGVEHEFSIVDVLEVSDQRYAILQPLGTVEEPDSAVIFRMEGDALVTIEDDAEFDRVRAAYEAESETADGESPDGADVTTPESGANDGRRSSPGDAAAGEPSGDHDTKPTY